MTSDTKEDIIYTIFNNLIEQLDNLLHYQIKEVGNIRCFLRKKPDDLTEFDKKQMTEDLDNIQTRFQVFRELVNSANKCFELLNLPKLELKWVINLDENKGE